MDARYACLFCGGSTEIGFVVDRGDGDRRRRQEWWAGEPESSFWIGVKKPDRTCRILTFRCVKCGFLMEFANPQEDQS
jgi:hypothetical protein